jgi:hypothetical protein
LHRVPELTVAGPEDDTLVSAMPEFDVALRNADTADRPLAVVLQLASRSDFSPPLLAEVAVPGDGARVRPPVPLPSLSPLFWRALARTARGDIVSATVGPRTAAAWVRLIQPNPTAGSTLTTRRPTFQWSSAQIPSPPGPWRFFVSVENLATREVLDFGPLGGDRFTVPQDLESNTSYRWAVTSALPTGESIVVRSTSTFVIIESTTPTVTLLYQNFPNPFPATRSTTTCIWFDLHQASRVRLTIHDIRGNLVRTIVPSGAVTGDFAAGRYGRGIAGSGESCDARFTWDGRGDDGRTMVQGVYLVRLRTQTHESFKKILFRGR